MEGTYDVMLGSKRMGEVSVQKLGLYWQFDCRCNLCGEVMYDLAVWVGECQVNLGLLTPGNGCFRLRTKLPMKRLGQGSPEFYLKPRHAEMKGCFVSVHPDEPFHYLRRLENAYLTKRGSQTGVIIVE